MNKNGTKKRKVVRGRFFKVVIVFLRIGLSFNKEVRIRKKKGFKYASKKMLKTHYKLANELYELAINLGGVTIKLCQFLSTRRDIFPVPYVEVLSKLQDNVPSVPFDELKVTIDSEYRDREYPFSSIDEKPLASASIGQVHRATLKNGDEVVLKVIKPGIEDIIDTDFAILFYVFKFFSNFKFMRDTGFDFDNILSEFITVTGDELNFKRELFIGKKFRKGLSKFSYLKIPYMYEEYSTEHIIVMEFVKGDKITDRDKWINRNNDPILIARRLVEIYVEQFMFFGYVHFDPHPGNILVLENSKICLLDFGMAGEITKEMSNGIKNGLIAFSHRDYRSLIKVIEKLGFIKKGADMNSINSVVQYLFNDILDTIELDMNSLQKVDITPVVDELVEIIYSQSFRLPYEWAFMGRAVGVLTGIIASLYPDFKLYDELSPYVNRLIKENTVDIVNRVIDSAKEFVVDIFALPKKATQIIHRVESKDLKFEVDLEEINIKINKIGALFVRGIAIFMMFVSGILSYSFYIIDRVGASIVFTVIAIGIAIFLIIFRQKLTKKEILKQTMTKKIDFMQ